MKKKTTNNTKNGIGLKSGKMKISQSLLKTLFAYKTNAECGLVVKAKYVDGIQFPSTEAMELGNYFEYICTGSLARDGHTPVAKILKSGKMSVDYARMNKQKENFDRIMSYYGFEIEETNYSFSSIHYSGIADIIARRNGERCIIDVKTSGLINDKWSDFGWEEEAMEYKDKLLVQAVQYKMLAKEEWGVKNIPFFFFVFSTKNENECKIYEVICDEATLITHANNIDEARKYFEIENKKGWVAKPDMKRCSKCPLATDCQYYTNVPAINTIYY